MLVLVGQIKHEEPLPRDVEHMNPHEVVEHPACRRVLDALAFLVRKCGLMLLQAHVQGVRLNHTIFTRRRAPLLQEPALRYDAVGKRRQQEVHHGNRRVLSQIFVCRRFKVSSPCP